jgi:hypothetical protein
MRLLLIISILILPSIFYPQDQIKSDKEGDKQFFKDTTIVFNGLKVEFVKCFATEKKLQMIVNVVNTENKYFILDPLDVFANVSTGDIRIRDTKHKKVIIEPNSEQKIKLEFEGPDYRVPAITINFTKMEMSDEAVTTFSFSDMSVTKENFCKSGPVTWFLEQKDFDIHKGIRLSGKVKYSGTKFLTIDLDKAVMITGDSGKYNNVGEKGGLIERYNNKYFDFKNNFEKEVLFFPAKRENLKEDKKAVINLSNVFTEHNLIPTNGFKINLRKGTPVKASG